MSKINMIKNSIISAMNGNIFQGIVDSKIKQEVPFFRKILIENYNNPEIFHGYINKINDAWGIILVNDFKKLIAKYNTEHEALIYKELQRKQEMIKMATEMAAKDMLENLEDLEVSPSMSSLIKDVKKTGISKRGIIKRRSKK